MDLRNPYTPTPPRPTPWTVGELLFFPVCWVLVALYVGWRLLTALVDGWDDLRHGRVPLVLRGLWGRPGLTPGEWLWVSVVVLLLASAAWRIQRSIDEDRSRYDRDVASCVQDGRPEYECRAVVR